jgi:dGTPase
MPVTRLQLERRERRILASYAQLSVESRGRRFAETPPEWRTHFQRDRDRVIHSRAFRRLEYKTQVFLNGSGDHLRTRLTHTMEVAAISRNIARALQINEDLTETIALAHDLGHPPFGHNGETALDRLMKGKGGFEHNQHSLRIVEELEQKYPTFPGLNLSWEVREGLVKHYTAYDHPSKRDGFNAKSSSLEAQVANLADEIAYYSHDLDDGLEAGLLEEQKLVRDVRIWRDAAACVKKAHGELAEECRRYFIIRCIIDDQVKDVVLTAEQHISEAGVRTADDVRLQPKALVQYSPKRRKLNLELRDYLYENLYFNPVVHEPNVKAVRMLGDLFNYFVEHPNEIGDFSRKRAGEIGLHRAICDYIAGMTDGYVHRTYAQIFGASKSKRLKRE